MSFDNVSAAKAVVVDAPVVRPTTVVRGVLLNDEPIPTQRIPRTPRIHSRRHTNNIIMEMVPALMPPTKPPTFVVELESSLLSVGPLLSVSTLSALVHVDTLVLTDVRKVLIAIDENVMSLMTLFNVFCK